MANDSGAGTLSERLSRRDFLRVSSVGGTAAILGVGALPGVHGVRATAAVGPHGHDSTRHALRLCSEASPRSLELVAAPGEAGIGGGVRAPGWLINESLPSPLLRVRRGEIFDATLRNGLPDHLILHWHGLTPPEEADGHPRLAVHKGGAYRYRFAVENRAGTYWYHSHAHARVARHTQAGIAGLLLVGDDEEDALGLPSGEREIPLILQDRKLDPHGLPSYENPNLMEGHHGDEPFGNGIHRPYLDVDAALYRFRILNGSNARIFRLERSDGGSLVLIGNDGGFIDRPRELASVDVAPGERVDVLVDLGDVPVGERVMLRSRRFSIAGMVRQIGAPDLHDVQLDLLELRVARKVDDEERVPDALPHLSLPDPDRSVRERTFRFSSSRDYFTRSMEAHHINGRSYDMERIDERVPFGETEIWSFTNDDWFTHPVHLHGTHFRVLSRSGGRGEVMPWERGLKDTVLLHPSETVQVAVRFHAHRGLFLIHCHNLEHEDVGMMLNVMVE